MRGSPWSIALGLIALAATLPACQRGLARRDVAAPIELRVPRPSLPRKARAGVGPTGPHGPLDPRDLLPLPAPLSREDAERRAGELLAAAAITEVQGLTEAQTRALADAGFDEELGLGIVLGLLGDCLDDGSQGCFAKLPEDDDAAKAFYRLVPALARLGSARTVSLLARLEEHGFFLGDLVDRTLETRAAKLTSAACPAPTPAEVEKEVSDLGDFVVLEADGAERSGREPTTAELADLAYFFAAIRRERPRPGNPPADPYSEANAALAKTHEEARRAGDRDAIVRVGFASFAALGHDLEANPAAPSEQLDILGPLARSLGRELELRGRFGEAIHAYRRGFAERHSGRVPVGNVHDRAARFALVRSAEGAGDCRLAVAARLYAPDEDAVDVHGPLRLSRAGWDVPRLYRGAALTHDRIELSIDPTAGGALTSQQAERTVARVSRWGDEAYDADLRALEGLADTARLAALPILSARIARGTEHERQRAIEALAHLAARPLVADVCGFERTGMAVPLAAGGVARTIRSVNAGCKTKLTPPQLAEILAILAKATNDRNWEIRAAAAQAIGAVASSPPAALTALLRDPAAPFGPGNYPVRDAARTAISRASSRLPASPLTATRSWPSRHRPRVHRTPRVRHRARCCVAL